MLFIDVAYSFQTQFYRKLRKYGHCHMDTVPAGKRTICYHMAILYHNGTAIIAFPHLKFSK